MPEHICSGEDHLKFEKRDLSIENLTRIESYKKNE